MLATKQQISIADVVQVLGGTSERYELDEESAKHFALAHCVKPLRKAATGTMTDGDRREAKSAYRMACAALGLDHE